MFVRSNGIRRRINGELAVWVINERGGCSEQFPADALVLEGRPHKKHRDVTRLAQMQHTDQLARVLCNQGDMIRFMPLRKSIDRRVPVKLCNPVLLIMR